MILQGKERGNPGPSGEHVWVSWRTQRDEGTNMDEYCEHDEVVFFGETPTHGPTGAECEVCGAVTDKIDVDVDYNGEVYYTPIWAP